MSVKLSPKMTLTKYHESTSLEKFVVLPMKGPHGCVTCAAGVFYERRRCREDANWYIKGKRCTGAVVADISGL